MAAMEEFFKAHYTPFRRAFWDYVQVVSNYNYFTWASAVLKVPAGDIDFYFDKAAAIAGVSADGKLEADISNLYFKDVPVVVNISTPQYFDALKNNQPINLVKLGDVLLQIIVWTELRGYAPAWIRYDATKMDMWGHAIKLDDMDKLVPTIEPLQAQLDATAKSLQDNHNTTLNAMQTLNYGEQTYNDQLAALQVIQDNILALRDSDALLVKISQACNATAMEQSLFGSDIELAAAVSFSAFQPLNNEPAIVQDFSTRLTAQGMLSKLVLDGTKEAIQQVNSAGNGNIQQATVTPENEPSNKKDATALWWLAGITVTVLLFSSNKKSNATAKATR